jgi:hypothetical protein
MSMDADHFQREIDSYKNMPAAEKARIRCVIGHMPYGLHEWTPGSAVYLAFVRDPVERALSQYHYIRGNPVLQRQIGLPEDSTCSLEAFLEAEKRMGMCNLQVRFLTGAGNMLDRFLPPYPPLPEDALEKALGNLRDEYAVVGVAKRFDESVVVMKMRLGWRHAHYTRRNVSRKRAARCEFPPELITRISEENALDAALCDAARKRLDRQIRELGDRFAPELRRMRRASRSRQLARDAVFALPRRLRRDT